MGLVSEKIEKRWKPMQDLSLNQDKFYSSARELFEGIVNWLDSDSICGLEHGEIECKLLENGYELLRRLLQGYFDKRSSDEIEGECRGSDEAKRTHQKRLERKLTTIFGTVIVNRIGYGGRKINSLVPLDAELNLPVEQYSHGLRQRVAVEVARSGFGETVEIIEKTTAAKIGKRQAEELAYHSAIDFEEFYQQPETVISTAFDEALYRDPNREKCFCALVDGNKQQLSLLKKLAKHHHLNLTIVLDIIHVIEYLWKAAFVFHSPTSQQAEVWVTKRLLLILEGKSSSVAAGMRRSATKRQLSQSQRQPVDNCARYLLNNREYLQYNHYLKAGLPIATGVIEGACRDLIKDRMDITGARWSLAGAEAVLRLRSLYISGDWDEYWRFHLELEHQRHHKALYKCGIPLMKQVIQARCSLIPPPLAISF